MKARRTFSASGGCALVGADAGNETEEQSVKKRVVLIAGMGTTPAVQTETVWALAHQSCGRGGCFCTNNLAYYSTQTVEGSKE